MAYKFRNGITGVGRQAAVYLADQDEYQTRRRGDVFVKKSGEFTQIYQGGQVLDGYYSLGKPDDSYPQYKVVASATARGTFGMRGDAGPATWATLPALAYYGKGWGMVPLTGIYGYLPNFDGESALAFNAEFSLTRDGIKFKDHLQLFFYLSPTQFSTLVTFHHGVYFNDGGVRRFSAGYSGMRVEGGQQVPFYIWEIDGEGAYAPMPYITNQLGIDPLIVECGPGNKLMLMRYHRPNYAGSLANPAGNPGYFFAYTTNAGRNWTVTTSGDMFNDFSSVVSLVPPSYTYGDVFNTAVNYIAVRAAALSGTRTAALAYVPYCVLGGTDGTTPIIKVKVKTGIIDHLANFGMYESGVLYDGDLANMPAAAIYGVNGGVVMMYVPDPDLPGELRFSTDGLTYTTVSTFPFPAYCTGLITTFDKKSIVCPMYDGTDHALYESKDLGVTWTKRAKIFPGGPVPPTGHPILQRFGAVTFLRQAGVPANATPATPWFTDCKYPAP